MSIDNLHEFVINLKESFASYAAVMNKGTDDIM